MSLTRLVPTTCDARVPRWAFVPAVLAPVGMIGGWLVAGAREPGFDAVRETISALAATSAAHPGIMTAGLVVTGVAHVATAAALRPVALLGRALHALGGAATLLVAFLPVDAAPRAHGLAAAVAFGALSLWPVAGARRGVRGVLSVRTSVCASGALLALLGWFVVELQGLGPGDDRTGLSERAVAGAQALWPLVVVALLVRAQRGRTSPADRAPRTGAGAHGARRTRPASSADAP